MHARPSAELVKCANLYKSNIILIHQDSKADAKSLLCILMLAATRGSKIAINANGCDANEAVQAIINLAGNNFNMEY